ncbi:hypothetical protein KSP40_PGU003659 [Platanthera guangdongensis]|uniref:Uncharacterized protein n=1 Tax=Platanthera guangdongensis TaxID=2320717 RepID=A0ABR2MIW2_9ASPA
MLQLFLIFPIQRPRLQVHSPTPPTPPFHHHPFIQYPQETLHRPTVSYPSNPLTCQTLTIVLITQDRTRALASWPFSATRLRLSSTLPSRFQSLLPRCSTLRCSTLHLLLRLLCRLPCRSWRGRRTPRCQEGGILTEENELCMTWIRVLRDLIQEETGEGGCRNWFAPINYRIYYLIDI